MPNDRPDLARRFDAIHFRHSPVYKDQIIILATAMPDSDLVDAFPPRLRRLTGNPDLPEDDFRMLQGDPVIIDNQDAHVMGIEIALFRRGVLPVRFIQRNRYNKGCADAFFAFHIDVAVHQLDNALCDRHSQASAAVSVCGGRVLLAERVENMREIFPAHSNARILECQADSSLAVKPLTFFNQEGYSSALRRELHRVAKNIEHHLFQLHGVANIVFVNFSNDSAFIMHAFVTTLAADHVVDLFKALGERELFLFDDHAPGLYAGHIQNVVDDAQQMVSGRINLSKILFDLV